MKRSIILSLAITFLAAPASGFKQENLDKLKATNACEMCDLRETYLREANLFRANLSNANLTGITATNLRGCPSSLPSGWVCENNALIQR